ncbi:hypothetical protein A3J20_02750 [Candidatus Gottesmanbacteria bacterium RIFCSPLOWO2_02_FULL_42_29]|uniref:Uncharacterized protein n=1 Tax=Candidatus Gottesmanbacteria bacterium GW2011_GWA2_42_18 TaxID=1618442 RepID=A0A0G1BK88_9BACT|nr:MAG: hypothetical protein UV09_C0014G0006 [Candidatus Gottesmanbacteria bacterium GW2011_GWA2_42_18]OGG12120.1 MAG: hypothetical protein A2781_03580 [Candidatus Gottesmanbacteria bacterium RIFCSPHIGHO2_01_FULL_42_27]OGG22041.1 MAG: hypothetical protein A3E72_00925 [Candidatus Gottesmanbacteria bacterium RIFCSPHIGHO2_12_FULL_43_26]OGG35644.1 MAG: hypothetical protein A3G68_05575 [Candidatus Gottesmanbacteria bacterium RIFCSPLOWO2_12_FULL_42_10]OGG36835.1 MAG: hypothetical protein A3J20_02750 
MFKKLIALAGILLIAASLYILFRLNQGEKLAASRDSKKQSYGFVEGPLPCNWEVKNPEKVMSESKSQAIVINVSNPTGETCQSVISVRSPGFDTSPSKDEQTISLKKDGKGSISWIITPRKSGSFDIALSDTLNTKIFGITVTNIFGLNALQAKIASVLGGLFGPMFTIPWWWDKLRGRGKPKPEVQKVTPDQ